MQLSKIILQLREKCPSLNMRVGGLIDWDDEKLIFKALPCAYVLPEADEVGAQEGAGGLYMQHITSKFVIKVFISKIARTELEAYDEIEIIRAEIFRALLGFCPYQPCKQIEYDNGHRLIFAEQGLACFEYVFSYEDVIRNGGNDNEIVYIDTVKLDTLNSIDVKLKDKDTNYTSHTIITLNKKEADTDVYKTP